MGCYEQLHPNIYMKNILFRCDGSVEIGMGHVVRCLALADHLNEHHNCNIHFAMRRSTLGINKVKESYPVIKSNETNFNYKEWLINCIKKKRANVLIMDMRDGLTREELKSIKKKTGIRVVTIDDSEDKRLEADLAFYPPVPQLKKLNWNEFKGKLYIGWEYVILRKEFLKQYLKPNNDIPNILVTMGGTDEKNMTQFVIESLNQMDEKFKVIIIVGNGYPYLEKLNKNLNDIKFEYEFYQNPENIAKVMSQSDFAIISFGQTAYELAALNVPSLYLSITKDHEESTQIFEKEKVGKSLGIYPISKEHLIEKVTDYLQKYDSRANLSYHANFLNISVLHRIAQIICQESVYA